MCTLATLAHCPMRDVRHTPPGAWPNESSDCALVVARAAAGSSSGNPASTPADTAAATAAAIHADTSASTPASTLADIPAGSSISQTRSHMTWVKIVSVMIAVALFAAGCDGKETVAEPLTGFKACPNPLVIQTDWFPEPEYGAIYGLFNGQGSMDINTGSFRGPLAADPEITLEVRSGGPYIGFQQSIVLAASDPDIFLTLLNTDDAVLSYKKFPTTAVFAPLDKSPLGLMFDPATYDIATWGDVKETDAIFNHFAGDTYPQWLVAQDLINESQLDPSYDGSPARFIAAEGRVLQQGFISQEPYNYEHVFQDWAKPVDTLLIHDTGFPNYSSSLAILDTRLDSDADECLKALVPTLQQSAVDFYTNPEVTNALILRAVDDLDSSWVLSKEGVKHSVATLIENELVGNGPNNTLGDFDMGRVQKMIDIIDGEVESVDVAEGLTAADIATNKYIDSSIGLD